VARLSFDAISTASSIIPPEFSGSPMIRMPLLDSVLGARLHMKVECLNPIRSFKGRGVSALIADLLDCEPRCRHLVCASAGNLGQALAYCGTRAGLRVTVVAAESASMMKLQRMRDLGAVVLVQGHDFDAAKAIAEEHARCVQGRLVVDSLDASTCHGAGTIGLETHAQCPTAAAVLLALGNGALATGVGAAYRYLSPSTQIVGVQAAGAPAMARSWHERRPVACDTAKTIADGIAVRLPIDEVVSDTWELLDDVVLVEEQQIASAMRLLLEHTGLMCEPSAAVGVAALLSQPQRWQGVDVVSVLCGSNIAPIDFLRLSRP
jgi:threonine dehydratase